MAQLWAVCLVLVACVVGSFGPILIKLGMNRHASRKVIGLIPIALSLATNWRIVLGFFFYGLSQILFIPALRGGDISVLFPLVASSYIWVTLLSLWMLNETLNKWKVIGLTGILLGVVLLGLGG